MIIIFQDFFYVWLILALFFLLLEMGSPGLFYFLSFFIGGLVSAIISCIVDSFIIQALSFFIATVCAFTLLRYLVFPFILKGRSEERTNVHALIGKRAIVEQEIVGQQLGFVRIINSRWAAQSVTGESIEEGAMVEIVGIRGGHVVVKKI